MLPPFEVGGVQEITACCASPEVAETETGEPGIFAVVADTEVELAELPTVLVATTTKE